MPGKAAIAHALGIAVHLCGDIADDFPLDAALTRLRAPELAVR